VLLARVFGWCETPRSPQCVAQDELDLTIQASQIVVRPALKRLQY